MLLTALRTEECSVGQFLEDAGLSSQRDPVFSGSAVPYHTVPIMFDTGIHLVLTLSVPLAVDKKAFILGHPKKT